MVYGSQYECDSQNHEGKKVKILLIPKKNNYLFIMGSQKFYLKIINENNNYVHLFKVENELSFHIGINKNINYMILDGMDLKHERKINRITGYCTIF